jgi:RNA polymerase sigma-70 factor (ECF subfamily)
MNSTIRSWLEMPMAERRAVHDHDQQVVRALSLATRTAVALLGPGEDAREVAQEVVVKTLARRSQLRDRDKFDAWVHRIATREAIQALRKRQGRRAVEEQLDESSYHATRTDADFSEAVAFADAARLALNQLGERERLAMVLHYVHDLSDSQIAKALGCRRGTVNSLLSRARTRLRSMPELREMTTTRREYDGEREH